jgi:histone H3/H4
MKERIQKLARQARIDVRHIENQADDDFADNLEKFAELIVRECAEICLEANDHKNILQHFGVEE